MNNAPAKSIGLLASWFGNGPWRSKSVLIALLVVLVGGGFWLSEPKLKTDPEIGNASHLSPTEDNSRASEEQSKPLPAYILVSASYVAGYCIGWFFRRVFRMLIFVVALAVGLLTLGRLTGYDLKPAQEQVKTAGTWAKRELDSVKEQLKRMLPSATGAGVGLFLGFRRRGRANPVTPSDVD